ncbi:hypothetical protein [Rubripirellula reticaptiva]|uniref:Uncharacterized protein n=1 Tax=Rubripirellula reticaptiva TaxID=2528013 RepID=A0A5C6ECB8_9BACT|nr:hypothetical protein [Rubripirellula reticaptiva]TWU46538.1 hypothetical protein Poly59_55110 [Rubripirellula reticaptiva]
MSQQRKTADSEIETLERSPSILDRTAETKQAKSIQNATQVGEVLDRVRYEADEHPAAMTGLVFVSGFALGVLATLAFCQSRPQPTGYQSYLPRNWRN